MRIILGSTSKRRKEILSFFSLPFIQADPNFDESTVKVLKDPAEYTCQIARKKAECVAKNYPNDIILTADTVVFYKDRYLLKPKDENEAFEMLKLLSGSEHQVFTGVCVKTPEKIFYKAEESKVHFQKLTDREIKLYHKNFFFHDKAGGYAIQDGGSILIKKIDGCFYNIMGLPISITKELLLKAGIDLWDFLKKSHS
jgi:septum formation protein